MLIPSVSLLELTARAAAVYGFLLIALRIGGKRQIGQLAPFDLVLILLVSNAVQNSINAGDNSLVGGLLSAAVLLALDAILAFITTRSRRFAHLLEGEPVVLVRDGRVNHRGLLRERISEATLHARLREAGASPPFTDVRLALLEVDGNISVLRHEAAEPRQGQP